MKAKEEPGAGTNSDTQPQELVQDLCVELQTNQTPTNQTQNLLYPPGLFLCSFRKSLSTSTLIKCTKAHINYIVCYISPIRSNFYDYQD